MGNNQFYFSAPEDIIEEINGINERINEKGYAMKKDAERHMELAREYQICNVCKKPYREIRMGMTVSIPGYNGKEYPFCFTPTCLKCQVESWSMDPEINPNLRK